MAFYKYPNILQKSDDGAFDMIHNPGTSAPYSGVYRCEGCGGEAVVDQPRILPPQNHHQHQAAQGAIRWRLIVAHA